MEYPITRLLPLLSDINQLITASPTILTLVLPCELIENITDSLADAPWINIESYVAVHQKEELGVGITWS
jgi:hypothetical protein